MQQMLRPPFLWALRNQLGRTSPRFLPPAPVAPRFQVVHCLPMSTARRVNLVLELEPYAHTSGRWLRRDKLEVDARYIEFDFEALCQKIIDRCPGASSIVACQKIEGGFNRVFSFTLNNEKKIVAKFPFRLAGPAKLTTASEVATVRYLQMKTNIPIPKLLDWNHDASDTNNAIGSEYIIMEHATGVSLHERWNRMAGDQQVRCIDAIYRTVKEIRPTNITSILDWQTASVEPAFWYLDEVLDFAATSEICTKTFKVSSQFLTPRLSGPRQMDDSLFRPFPYCYRTWKDGVVAFRHEMIETSRLWKDLGFHGQCPYPLPTPEELMKHQKEYRLFEAAQHLRNDLGGLLNTASDGWVPRESWKATELAHKELFDGMLEAVLSNPDLDDDELVKDEVTLRSIWPFDID